MTLFDGTRTFGWHNLAFVADTHNPVKPSEVHIAAVHGWGTRAVGPDSDAILVTTDRETGWVTSFINKTNVAILETNAASYPVRSASRYRQRQVDFFDLQTGERASRALNPNEIWRFPHNITNAGVHLGMFIADMPRPLDPEPFEEAPARETLFEKTFGRPFSDRADDIRVGLNPFTPPSRLITLIGVLQFIAGEGMAAQVEGAFATKAEKPTLYQLLEVPPPESEVRPLQITNRHLQSKRVVGRGEFAGPLVWLIDEPSPQTLWNLDGRFADTGYILLSNQHSEPVCTETPHCRIRLSVAPENVSSHGFTLARLRLREGQKLIMGTAVHGAHSWFEGDPPDGGTLSGISADERLEEALVFHRARLDSNGSELAVEILRG